jgi:Mn2+/Fe2+ NRAMP family transporter
MEQTTQAATPPPPKVSLTWWQQVKSHPLARVGPGLITGAADDDPSGIATYSQAGAQFGLDMLWTMPLAYPLMSAIQCMCAFIGRTTGKGLAANIKTAFPPIVLKGVVLGLLAANTLNIAADLAAMGEAGALVTGIDRHIMTAAFVAVTLLLQIFVPYDRYVFFLKWLTLSLLAYVAVLFVVHVSWATVALHTFVPRFKADASAAAVVVAIFGTTISPYLFFWQASEEIEDMEAQNAPGLVDDPASAPRELRRIRWDTWTGMFYSDLVAFFIMLATAVTLHAAGVTNIQTAAQAASALKPLAGEFAFVLFTIGIVGVGLLAVPVLAGSGAYALADTMGWPYGLGRKLSEARGFYGVITLSVLAALFLQYSPIDPMKGLFWSAVINGVVAVPLMAVIILLVSKKSVMGPFTVSRTLVILGWIATAVMGAAAVRMVIP